MRDGPWPQPLGRLQPGEFRSAIGSGRDWREATRACLDRLGNVRDGTLGVVYLADALSDDAGSILTLLRQLTGVADWVGTVGIGVIGDDRELFDTPALSVLVGRLPAGQVRLLPRFTSVEQTGLDGDLADWARAAQPVLGLVHADPRNPQTPAIVEALSRASGAFLVGGLTSSRHAFAQIAGGQGEGGVSGVLFGLEVPVVTGLTQGCSPIGPIHMVTACEDHIVAELDGRPALDVFKEDIGDLLARDLRRTAGYIFAALPVPGSDTGDYLVRNLVGLDPRAGLVAIAHHLVPGDRLMFVRRDAAAAVQDLGRMLAGVTRRLGGQRPRGAVYVSCLARGPNQFGTQSEEIAQVQAALGSVPLVGFFANGEISHDRLYGYTGVLTVFL